MKVQIQLDIDISARATYRDGEVSLSLTGAMPLAPGQERQVSTSISSGFSEKTLDKFKAAFEAALAEQQEKLITVTQVGQSEALAVAARMGEL